MQRSAFPQKNKKITENKADRTPSYHLMLLFGNMMASRAATVVKERWTYDYDYANIRVFFLQYLNFSGMVVLKHREATKHSH